MKHNSSPLAALRAYANPYYAFDGTVGINFLIEMLGR